MELPETAQAILAMIQGQGGQWVSRSDIAKALDKKRLNGTDLAYLEIMALNGLIEEKKIDDSTPIGYQWMYKAAE